MSSAEILSHEMQADWPHRVCLPYGIDLLQFARWISAVNDVQISAQFDIVIGERPYPWSGSGVIDLFSKIQTKCVGYILDNSYLICKHPRSIIFFDIHERFSFFSADPELLKQLYPFSREVLWENFALVQEDDNDIPLAEVFQVVQSVQDLG